MIRVECPKPCGRIRTSPCSTICRADFDDPDTIVYVRTPREAEAVA